MGPHTRQLPEPPSSVSEMSLSVKWGWMPTMPAAQVRQLMETSGGVLPPDTLFPQLNTSTLEALRLGIKGPASPGSPVFQR